MSRSGDVQYIGGYHDACGGYHEYIGGYHEYIGGYHEYIGRYHEYIGGCSVHWGMFSTSGFSIEIERFLPTCPPTCSMISPDVLNIP